MSSFVLQPLDGRGWTGATGASATVKVVSADESVAMQGAICSSAKPPNLIVAGGAVSVTLADGAQVLTISINHVFPVSDWLVVEVDAGGETQTLAGVFADQALPDPYSLDINLQGK